MKVSNNSLGKINLLPLLVLVVTCAVLATGAISLRYWQKNKQMSEGFKLGEMAWEQQNWPEAARQYGLYITKDNTNIEVLRKYAQSHLNIRPRTASNINQALQSYRIILRNKPDDNDALKQACSIYLGTGAAGECELLVNDYLTHDKDDNEVHALLAGALAVQNKQTELEKAMQLYPDHKLEYYQMLYSVLMRQSKAQQAAELLKQIIAEYPQEIEAYDLLARTVHSNQALFNEKAEKWVNEAVSTAPDNALSYIARARYYIGTRQNEIAVSDLNKAFDLSKDNTNYKLHISSLYASIGNYGMARAICGDIYENDHQNLEALTAMLNYASLEGDKALITEIADSGMEKLNNTNKWDFIPTAIESYCIAGENDKAEVLIQQVANKDTMPEYIAYWKGLIARNTDDLNNTIQYFNTAVQLGYNNDKVKLLLAEAYEKNGNTTSAILEYKKILSSSRDNAAVMVRLADLYLRNNNYAETQNLINKILQVSPGDKRAVFLLMKTMIESADITKLKNDLNYYNDLMDKISQYRSHIDDQQQFKTLQFQLALAADKAGDAKAILQELGKTGISEEQQENLQLALYLSSGEKEKAMDLLGRQIAREPDNIDLILREISLLAGSNQYESAHAIIDKALTKFTSELAIKKLYFAKADIYSLQSKEDPQMEDKAIEQIKKLLAISPNDLTALQKILNYQSIISDHAICMQYINKIKDSEGINGRIWKIELARMRIRNQDTIRTELQESITHLKENIAANPGDTTSSVLLAMAYEKDGQMLLAANIWQEAYNYDTFNNNYALSAIHCFLDAGKFNEADELIATLLRQEPDNPTLINLEVSRLLRNNNIVKAQEILSELYAQGKCNSQQKLTLANIRSMQNNYTGAHAIFDEIMADDDYDFNIIAAKASTYIKEQKYLEAVALSDLAITKFKTAQAYLLKARLLINSDQKDLAQIELNNALSSGSITESDYFNAVSIYFDLGQRDTATALAKETYTKYPENISITRLYIQLLLAEQQSQETGADLLEKALNEFPDDYILKFLKARLLYSKGTRPDLDEASDILNKILAQQPENIQAWLLAGEIEFNRQQYQRVVDIIYQGLSFNPGNQDLLLLKARAENEFSPELAVATIKTLQSINTSDANIAIKLATIYASQNNNKEALELLETAEKLTTNKDQIEAIKLLRSLIEYRSGDVKAKEYAQNILAQKPDSINAFSVLLEIYISDQNWDLAQNVIEQWQENNKEDTDSLFEAIRILARKKDIPQAKHLVIEICNNILAIKPGNIDAMHIKASLDLIGKNNTQAINIYREILSNDPKNVIAINNMAWMLCEDQNNPQEALKLALQGLEYSPEYADLIDTTGVIYYKLGDYQKSEEMLLKCINLYNTNNPALTGTFYHLGRTYYKLKDSVQSGVYLKKALEYNETSNVLSDIEIADINEMLK